ncbi:hypothetical protein EVAR_90214_1 [Eumeta japonica]|uniref:Uncharacterized protein n=1 Tax=Eumeta variegata TaxID=151549 RepID=A0A4C1WX16_EUMVA|nr:hypothetical protein EVAR_90214_1 [Eumeta japonica]
MAATTEPVYKSAPAMESAAMTYKSAAGLNGTAAVRPSQRVTIGSTLKAFIRHQSRAKSLRRASGHSICPAAISHARKEPIDIFDGSFLPSGRVSAGSGMAGDDGDMKAEFEGF